MFKRFKNKKHQQQPSSARQKEEGGSGGREPSLNGILRNGHGQQEMGHGSSPPRQSVESGRQRSSEAPPRSVGLPDYMRNPNAVVDDACPWRHGRPPDYTAANRNYMKERSNMWPAGSLEDLVSNLIKNWKKETSHKSRLEDWRTVNTHKYTFSCNGGQEHSAEEMQELGTSNALIQEAAFYSAKSTGFDESHEIFKTALPGGFSWEVTDVYSGPPVMAFKWRHWGRMTGKLVCPIGPDTKLEAEATNQEVEIWGVSVVHLDSDFKINKMEVFYDPHELMASLVDARSLTYKTPEIDDAKILSSTDMRNLNLMESVASSDGFMTTNNEKEFDDNASTFEALVGEPSGHGLPATFKPTLSGRTPPDPTPKAPPSPSGREMHHEDFSTGQASGGSKITQGSNSQQLQSLGHGNTRNSRGSESPKSAHVSLSNGIADLPGGESALPSDNALLSALMEKPRKALPGSRCPFPHNA